MNIFSKQLLMAGGSKYKAYLLLGSSAVDVKTLGFNEPIDPDKCFGASDDSTQCNYVILNGKLFYYSSSTLTQVGADNTWTAVSGFSSDNPLCYAYGINAGRLFQLSGSTASQIGTDNTWTAVSGFSGNIKTDSIFSNSYWALGINSGAVYKTIGNSIEKLTGNNDNFSAISGYVYNSSAGSNAYGIRNGQIYYTNGTAMNLIDSSYNSAVCGLSGVFDSPKSQYALALTRNGRLLFINGFSISFASSLGDNWTAFSGCCSSSKSVYAYAVNSGKLYQFDSTTSLNQIGTAVNWLMTAGKQAAYYSYYNYTQPVLYAYAVNTLKELYAFYNGLNKLLDGCIKVMGAGGAGYPALAVCEA